MARMKPTIQWKGRARVGWLSTTGPRGSETLTAEDARLRITSELGDFEFRPATVERIERAGFFPWFWIGIQIYHRVSSYPRNIGFWPRSASTRAGPQELRRRGYQVG
jgi:hypothetical protein